MPKTNVIRLVDDFLIPHLDNGTFGDKLEWLEPEKGEFGMPWIHRGNSKYHNSDGVVAEQWAIVKKLWDPFHPKASSRAKQRLRAALYKLKNIKEISDAKYYKKYKIVNIEELRRKSTSDSKMEEDSGYVSTSTSSAKNNYIESNEESRSFSNIKAEHCQQMNTQIIEGCSQPFSFYDAQIEEPLFASWYSQTVTNKENFNLKLFDELE